MYTSISFETSEIKSWFGVKKTPNDVVDHRERERALTEEPS